MKRKVLALFLSLAMVCSVVPATTLQAQGIHTAEAVEGTETTDEVDVVQDAAQVDDSEEKQKTNAAARGTIEGTENWGDNVALDAKAEAGYTNTYASGAGAINDGKLTTNAAEEGWNSWGGNDSNYPMSVTLTWETQHVLKGMSVMWWADNAQQESEGGVTFPKSAYVEYLDETGEWQRIKDVGLAHGGINGADGVWNVVDFEQEIETTSLRLIVERSGTVSNGFGISEWEAYGSMVSDKLLGAKISGAGSLAVEAEAEYTGTAVPEAMAEGASFAWTISPSDVAAIQGNANTGKVSVKALKPGNTTLKLTVTKDGVSKEASLAIQVEGIAGIDTYKTATAAGVAPILPDSVVAKGLKFDEATPSAKSANRPDFDFAEEFNDSLIPVTWEEVPAAKYAADQAGKTFTVKGTAAYGGKTYEATAEIAVSNPANTASSNSSVTFENVQLEDDFWAPKQDTNAMVSLNKAIEEIGKAKGGEPNFDNAIKKLNGESYNGFEGFVFQDSDIYKSIEAISYTLSATQHETGDAIVQQRKKLQDTIDRWIEKIEKVQYADGYIDTFFTLREPSWRDRGGGGPGTHRWRYFANHEMYNAGHFLESVVAYTRYREGINSPDYRLYVAGKRFADHIVALFGPNGTRHEVPGHEEIELAIVKFGRLVEQYEGEGAGQKYFDTAQTLIDRRGENSSLRESGYSGGNYSQDKTPFAQAENAVGHSVRANYFYTGAADVATLLEDTNPTKIAYLNSLDTIWEAVSERKTYITGGIGTTTQTSESEGYGDDYDLPNDQSYCEICAAIAAANWNQRMNLLHEDGKYADMVERNLYNSILVGTNLDGNLYFYSTLLQVASGNRRSEWFNCACCPPNLMRTIASLGGYMYTVHNDNLFINMYVGSTGNVTVDNTPVTLKQETDYPWDGAVKLTVTPEQSKAFTMKVRIPGWVQEQDNKNVTIKVNGTAVDASVAKGYATITRTWAKGDVVTIDMPMEIRKTEAHPKVVANEGRIALQRGPIVYCMEKAGNAQLNSDIENFNPLDIVIPRDAKLKATYNKDLLKGVVEITGEARYNLYGDLLPIEIQAIPYYAWNNRGDDADYIEGQVKNSSSKMLIWTQADEAKQEAVSGTADDAAYDAKVTSDKIYSGARIEGVKTNWEPTSSSMGNGLGWSNWESEPGSEHWLMYEWDEPITTKQMQIYWYDNHDWDRSPATLKVQYQDESGAWKDATMLTEYEGVADKNDQYNVIDLEEITTKAIRLLMTVRSEPSTVKSIGVYRWKVMLDKDSVAANVQRMIGKIGTVESSIACRKAIYDARMAYESLSDELKAKVTNYNVLTAAEASYKKLNEDAAAPVIALINKIGDAQTDDAKKKAVADARAAYDALLRIQKAEVSNYRLLLDAEEGGSGEDAAVKDVSSKIDAIGTVAYNAECKAKIDAARAAYNALSDAQKALVTNYKALTDAEAKYASLKADADKINNVIAKINAIGTVAYNAECKARIDAARAAYNALTSDQKTQVTNYKVLTDAEAKYASLKPVQPQKVDISKATVSKISTKYYNGKSIKPSVTVTYNGKKLAKDKDYTVSYSSNKNIGTAKVKIAGKGDYTGSVTKSFQITVKKGASYKVGGYKYKITNAKTSGKGTVAVTGSSASKKSLKKISIADTVKIGGKKFKVTEIGKSAFSGYSKVTSATIGANATKIGEKAFYNCKKLKSINIKTKSLKSVGKNAFKNIHKNATIKVPKNKLKSYQKLLKSKGQKKSVKIK